MPPIIELLEDRRLFVRYSGPIVISSGGDYSGNWESNDPGVPAVVVMTTDPVVIEDSNLRGRGDLIANGVDGTNITVTNTNGFGLNPDIAGLSAGRFFDVQNAANVLLDHNAMTGTSGILIDGFVGSAAKGHTIRIINNRALNIDGRKSDGAGSYLTYNTRVNRKSGQSEDGFNTVQFVQIAHALNVAGVDIAWNKVINQPGLSRVEDNISIFESGGTSDSPIVIHDNFIQGAYNIEPGQTDTHDGHWNYDWSYSGGGIMLGDGNAAYVTAFKNVIVSTTNYGIAITAGRDIDFHDNTLISAGKLADGQVIADQNVGASIWNATGNDGGPFFNDTGEHNTIGWMTASGANNEWTPDASGWTDNIDWPGTVTLADESRALHLWIHHLASR